MVLLILYAVLLNGSILYHAWGVVRRLGHYIYPLDDTYIHLAVARNLAFHNTWGINPGQFSSASSSPFFTCLLSLAIKLFGANDYIPLVLNGILANGILIFMYLFFRSYPFSFFLTAFFVVGASLLPIQVVVGMEAPLQILMVLFMMQSFRDWQRTQYADGKKQKLFWATLAWAGLVRYELLFPGLLLLIFALWGGAPWRKVFSAAFFLLAPVVLFGFWCMAHAEFFLPNSVLSKSRLRLQGETLGQMVRDALVTLFSNQHHLYSLATLVVVSLSHAKPITGSFFSNLKTNIFWQKAALPACTILTLLAHMTLGGVGWLFRYEAYLMAMIGVTMGTSLNWQYLRRQNFRYRILLALCGFLTLNSVTQLGIGNYALLRAAHQNIHDQQWQIARFLHQYFPKKIVAVNDIGLISYKADVEVVDMVGIGTSSILRLWLYAPEKVADSLNALSYDLMVIYDSWFRQIPFEGRCAVGQICIPNNRICGDSVVSFYVSCRDTGGLRKACQALKEFAPSLPQGVAYRPADCP
ncbi:MAG: hypothetical protein NZM15_04530 [Flavobacteriales bacterium]|nr:hypothetical protein [Flavobacteriales bacterium]MDW8431952.1 hypothetical protein [Flavobacteriales bacterium]